MHLVLAFLLSLAYNHTITRFTLGVMNFMIFFKKEVRSDVLSSWTLVFTSPKSIFSLGYLLPAVDVGALKN